MVLYKKIPKLHYSIIFVQCRFPTQLRVLYYHYPYYPTLHLFPLWSLFCFRLDILVWLQPSYSVIHKYKYFISWLWFKETILLALNLAADYHQASVREYSPTWSINGNHDLSSAAKLIGCDCYTLYCWSIVKITSINSMRKYEQL